MNERSDSSQPTVIVTGSAEKPDFKRRPMVLVIALIAYAAFMSLLIVWALRLRHAHV